MPIIEFIQDYPLALTVAGVMLSALSRGNSLISGTGLAVTTFALGVMVGSIGS